MSRPSSGSLRPDYDIVRYAPSLHRACQYSSTKRRAIGVCKYVPAAEYILHVADSDNGEPRANCCELELCEHIQAVRSCSCRITNPDSKAKWCRERSRKAASDGSRQDKYLKLNLSHGTCAPCNLHSHVGTLPFFMFPVTLSRSKLGFPFLFHSGIHYYAILNMVCLLWTVWHPSAGLCSPKHRPFVDTCCQWVINLTVRR